MHLFNISKIHLTFICPNTLDCETAKCEDKFNATIESLLTSGTPICPECDDEMICAPYAECEGEPHATL